MRLFAQIAILSLMFLTAATTNAASPDDVSTATKGITEILNKQAKAWNAADIPEFMKYYWKSDKLTFSSGGTTRRGWKATLESYQKRYSTPAKMGQLRFSELEIDLLGEDVALVLGKWQLKRTDDPDVGGNFSLVFRKLEGRWLIIHDHSSSLTK